MKNRIIIFSLLAISVCINPTPTLAADAGADSTVQENQVKSKYEWKKNIVTTFFWIGQGSTSYSDTTNTASAWDTQWTQDYGGTDDPDQRVGSLPRKFAATRNPFYVALPFNDEKFQDLAKKYVPWYKEPPRGQKYTSLCRGHWIEIRTKDGKTCFAQWEDVGPLRYDHASYVFGDDRPHDFNKAGLDVSPAVHDYLGLSGLDVTDWRFVEAEDVPYGPWLEYNEQAVMLSKIIQDERLAAQNSGKKTSSNR